MRSALALLLVCSSIIVVSGCAGKWEQIFAGDWSKASDAQGENTSDVRTMYWPSLEPAQYRLKAPKADNIFLVWVPLDYDPEYSWPVIFCYHGTGGSTPALYPSHHVLC